MASINESPPRSSTRADGVGETDVQEEAQQAAGQAQEKATQAAGQAQEKAQQAAGKVQDRLREQLDERSTQAAEQINEQASDLRSVGESLRREGKDGPARAADQLAGYAEKVGGYLREKDSHALLADAEDLGRRQPWALAAGSLVLGFAASRVLKASSGRRYRGGLTVERPAGVYPAAPAVGSNVGSELPVGNGTPASPGGVSQL